MSDISSGHSQSDFARAGQPVPFFGQLASYLRTRIKMRKKKKGCLDRTKPTHYTKMVKVHPLAGKCGEGPPLAPELWKWRAGNRLNDMYFTSPTGEKFRSRPELNIYLATLDDPPPADSFQWRVTEECEDVWKESIVPTFKSIVTGGYVLDSVLLLEVASWDARTPQKKQSGEGGSQRQSGEGSSKRQGEEGSSKKKTGKRKDDSKDMEEKGKKKVKTEPPSTPQQSSLPEKVPSPISEPISEPAPERGADDTVGAFYTTPSARPRPKMKATKKDKFDRDWGDRFFPNVLASKASWKWLYDNEVATRFLAEAERLNEKSDSELADFRNILLHRSSDMNNISRYSNQVLRVFVQILRNVQPPITMGKVELADLVVNWKCKKRHHWCLLETSRLAPSDPKASKMDSFSSGSKEEKATWQHATDASSKGSIPAPQDMTNSEHIGSSSAEGDNLVSRSNRRSKGVQLEVSLGNIHKTRSNSQPSQSPLDLNVKVPSTSEDYSRRLSKANVEPGPLLDSQHNHEGNADASNPNASIFQAGAEHPQSGGMTSSSYGHVNPGSGAVEAPVDPQDVVMASEAVYNVQYKESESVVILDRVAKNSRRGQPAANQQEEETVSLPPRTENMGSSTGINVSQDVEYTQLAPSTPLSYHFDRECSVCWCKICSKDQAFCRGCMCCLCPKPVKPEDDWMALKCECKHICHVKCALEENLAGVVRDLNLDGELSCPSCCRKMDLRPFFEKSFDRLYGADKMRPTDLGPLAVLVLQLLQGTQNKKYTYLQKLVAELYDLMEHFPIQNLVRLLLSEIKDELHEPLSPESGASHVGEEAITAAISKRVDMKPLFSTLESAYQGAIDQTKVARAAQASNKAKRKDVEQSQVVVSPARILEQIEIQKKKAQQEFEKLGRLKSTMVKPETGSFADIDASMNKWLESVRVQRRAVEAAETELHRLQNQYKQSIGM